MPSYIIFEIRYPSLSPFPIYIPNFVGPNSHLDLERKAERTSRIPHFSMAVITSADARHGPALDDDDWLSDTSSILTEIGSQDFPKYFLERDNRLFPSRRLFPSHGEPYPSYPFPVDGHEQNVRALLWLHYRNSTRCI